MTTVDEILGNGRIVSMKGAPEAVLDKCTSIAHAGGVRPLTDEDKKAILARADGMANRALRVLAFAGKPLGSGDPQEIDFVESDLIFAGLAGMMDPPREEVMDAISVSKRAGIRPVMITGDHRLTARAIGKELDIGNGEVIEGADLERMSEDELQERIDEVSVFARVTAEHKVRIVEALKKRGNIVAMTGDGVNDAPALAQAHGGIAIGAGTDVTIQAADIILVRNDPRDVVNIISLSKKTYSKMLQNLLWATGYNVIAIPLAAGVLYAWGFLLSPAAGAVLMSLSTVIVAVNARRLGM